MTRGTRREWLAIALSQQQPAFGWSVVIESRLAVRLATTFTTTLHQSPSAAAALARQVSWTVESDDDGLWMTMTFPDGTYSAVGGDWPEQPDGLLWYVDDAAYTLAGQGGAPCHDGE